MYTLTPEDNERNHWFREYWEDLFECDIDHRTTSNEVLKRRRRHNDDNNDINNEDFDEPATDGFHKRWRRQGN
jgi:hypothetical protein